MPQTAGGGGGGGSGDGVVYVPADWMKQIGSPSKKVSDDDFERERISWFRRRFGTPLDMIFGGQLRFLLAAALLTTFGLWMHINNKQSADAGQRSSDAAAHHRSDTDQGNDIARQDGFHPLSPRRF